ncbi:hypothetical protein EC973_005031 [Apophysomyces ossiformis]|uniref:MHD domain-containing protein n=1 Tax=Apophysomyces ossiformis TaxID=679940 RepID=A0A8H7BWE5_9FUNG|nr:hypothetical protein EC973_005031 [Apophysomyces ossiformis]
MGQSYQIADEARWDRLKSLVEKFEQIRVEQMKKCIEVANTAISATTAFDTKREIQDFCYRRGSNLTKSTPLIAESKRSHRDSSLNETSSSIRSTSGRVRSLLRRKPKNDTPQKLTESSFAHIHEEPVAQSEAFQPQVNATSSVPAQMDHENVDLTEPPSNEIIQNRSPLMPTNNVLPNESSTIDSEGYTVPPPDNSVITNAMGNLSDEPQELGHDPYSTQLLKFDIKANAVHNEENNQEAKATLTRMASLLRESSPTVSRRSRGRRDNVRSSTLDSNVSAKLSLWSVPHGGDIVRKGSNMSLRSTSDVASTNPFRQSSFDLSTPTSIHTLSTQGSRSPSLAHESPWQLHPISESSQPQVYANIRETVDMSVDLALRNQVRVSGQIKLIYNGPIPATTPLLIRLKSTDKLETITPNPAYVEPFEDQTDIYALKTEMLENNRGMPVSCFTYQLQLNNEDRSLLPIQLYPSWKCTEEHSLLMIKYQINPSFEPRKGQAMVCVKFDQVPVNSAQSTPQAVWDATKCQLTWTAEALLEQQQQYQQALQTEGVNQKPPRLLAKFVTQKKGGPQPVVLKYYCKDTLASNISVEAVPVFGSSLEVKQVHTLVKSGNLSF